MNKAKTPRVTNATREDLEAVAEVIEERMYISFDICLERILHISRKCDGKEIFNAYTLAGKNKSHSEIAEELAIVFAREFASAHLLPMHFNVDELEEILVDHKWETEYEWYCKTRKAMGGTDHE